MIRPISVRMAEAKAAMVEQRRRAPRVFYLNPADFAAFEATNPPMIEAMFALPLGHRPSPMKCLGFEAVAVRRSGAKPDARGRIASRLFCCAGTTVQVPAA